VVQHVESVRDVQLNNYVGVRGVRVKYDIQEKRILAQWEETCWRPAVCKTFSYVDVKI
jgi:hypothetical protein